MYQSLLTRRYLTSKLMPLLAALAVMLCSAMVLITWSIMGGFLEKFLDLGKNEGDVTIRWQTTGFAHYEDLIGMLEADPLVLAAAPAVESYGLIALPDDRLLPVQVRGIDARYRRVAAYEDSLWWKPIDKPLPKDTAREDPRLDAPASLAQTLEDGLRLQEIDPESGRLVPAVVLGIEVAGFSQRNPRGWYDLAPGILVRKSGGGDDPFRRLSPFLPEHSVVLNVLPLTSGGRDIKITSRKLPVANEFRTGVFEADSKTVLMDLAELQRMLKLDRGERLGPRRGNPYDLDAAAATREVIGVTEARATSVIVKAKPGIGLPALRDRTVEIYAAFAAKHGDAVPSAEAMARGRSIATWEANHAMFIGAVKHEIALVLGLLLFISFVAVFLVLSIFWAMVSEKTRDIGVLRAIGAGRAGVVWLWLRYGVALGAVGVVLGLALATLIVWNINPIHTWLGQTFGLVLWDPRVYLFSDLPNKVVPYKAAVVAGGGLLFSILGALIPALRAASYDPVKSLRFE